MLQLYSSEQYYLIASVDNEANYYWFAFQRGCTALMMATMNGEAAAVELLLKHNANEDLCDQVSIA